MRLGRIGGALWSAALFTGTGCAIEAADPNEACEFGCPGEAEETTSTGEPAGSDGGGSGEPDDAPGEPNDSDDRKEPEGPSGDPDGGGDGPVPACCDVRVSECLQEGGNTSSCEAIGTMCETRECEGLTELCPLDGFPISGACAQTYEDCYGFRFNKCQRLGYSACLDAIGDEPMCAARAEACEDRFAYCAEILGACAPGDPACDDGDGHDESSLANLMYECHDWGHDFDPCWAIYQGCTQGEATCAEELRTCVNENRRPPLCEPEFPDDGHGDDSGTEDGPCCDQVYLDCSEAGSSPTLCTSLQTMCETGACESLTAVCPLDSFPLSEACADAYQDCFGLRVNKCQRVAYGSCMNALDDDAFCTARDQACTEREAYCAELVSYCDHDDAECAFEPDPTAAGLYYDCTDWGHAFDPCWAQHEACSADEATCDQALTQCTNTGGLGHGCDTYDATGSS